MCKNKPFFCKHFHKKKRMEVSKMLYNTPDTLTLKELQKVLHVGKNTALKLIHENIITGHLIGGKWLVLREDVEEYILHA